MKYYVKYKISENIAETPEGYLICIGVPIARTGEMVYGKDETPLDPDSNGTVLITREEDEVFRPQTIASFEGKAITIKHPENFVGPDNWSELAKGILQNVRRGEGDQKDDLIADLLITDKMAIGLVRHGLREVSCGYEADYEQTDKGKGKQKNIIGNHLALVNQGRAGSSYAINDHKGDTKMNLKDRIKAIFAKAQDEAMKMAEDEDKEKKDDAKDEDKEDKSEDAGAYDELVKMVKDLGAKISAMAPKDEEKKDDDKESKDDDKDDDDKKDDESKDDESSGLEDRIKALEACVEKMMEKSGDDAEEESEDEDEESEDDDFESSSMVGDDGEVLSRAEILAPGIKKSKDIKVKALKSAYDTKEGKKVIDSLNGGKAPTYDSKEKVETLFIAASEVLKASRTAELSKTKHTKDSDDSTDDQGPIDAEKMNEINAKFYKKA